MSRRTGLIAALLGGIAIVAILAWLYRPEMAETDGGGESGKPVTPAQIERGRYLARAGNCIACHTVQGQPEYAGGRRLPTPFGDVYSTNLTPDEATGIGVWTPTDFWRALHYGKSRDGRRLYPAFPYTNYTLLTREDADAIFAYLQSLPPVRSERIAPQLRFPYNTAIAQLVWRALYFKPGMFVHDEKQSPTWNRGAYLVEGLGHCNACHTARGWLGGLDRTADYAGGPIPMLGWDALPLAPQSPMSGADTAAMATLLKTGVSRRDAATGPMAEVVFHSLQYLRDDDIAAMVAYIRTLPRNKLPSAPLVPYVADEEKKPLLALGSVVYKEHCSACHGDDGKGKSHVYPALAGNRLVNSISAVNAMQSVLFGGYGPSTVANPRPYGMPSYGQQLSNEQVAGVLTYIRSSWGNDAPAVSTVEVGRR